MLCFQHMGLGWTVAFGWKSLHVCQQDRQIGFVDYVETTMAIYSTVLLHYLTQVILCKVQDPNCKVFIVERFHSRAYSTQFVVP